MKKSLIDVIFASEKRKGVLLLLKDEAREMDNLLNALRTTRTALLPQIRILENHYLIRDYQDVYELTTIGKLIVDEMIPLLNTVDTLDTDIDYWGTHDLRFIPPHLLDRINELASCAIINPSLEEMYEAHNEFNQVTKQQKFQFSINSFFYPNFPDIFEELLSNDVEMHVVVSQSLFDKLKIDNYEDIQKIIRHKLVNFYLYPNKLKFLNFGFNKTSVTITLLKANGEFDNRQILCSAPSAVQWAKEFSEYYLKESIQITEL